MLLETVIALLSLLDTTVAIHMFNVALRKNGGICVGASTSYNNKTGCGKAIDGKLDHNSMWMTRSEGNGSWIKLQFSNFYLIKTARFMQHSSSKEQNKDILLIFSDNSEQTLTLTQNNGSTWKHDVALWDSFELEPVLTNTVNISVLTVYSSFNNGFREVEFYVDLDSSWASWFQWSKCIGSCDVGFQIRTRTCLNPFGGPTCEGAVQQIRTCDPTTCFRDSLSPVPAMQKSKVQNSGPEVTIAIVLGSLCMVLLLCVIMVLILLWTRSTKGMAAAAYGTASESILFHPESSDC